jgi:hypothetical protein
VTVTTHETTVVADDQVPTVAIAASFDASRHDAPAPERLVGTFTFAGAPDGVSVATVTFVALPDGRTRLTGRNVVQSFEIGNPALAASIESGVVEGYEDPDELIGSLS